MRFAKAYVEITNQCDRSCAFCPRSSRPPAFMSEEDFDRVLDRLRGRTGLVYLHVMGEPLIHPDLARLLSLCAERGMGAAITTNGGLLSERGPILLSSPALRRVNVSLHSRSGGGEETRRYLEAAADFARKADAAGIVVSLRLWNYPAGDPGADPELLGAVREAFGARAPSSSGDLSFRGLRLGPRSYLNAARAFEWPSLDSPLQGDRGYCRGLKDQVGILVDGTVVPCCLDGQGAVALGNVLKEGLDDILEGERARAIISGFARRRVVEELCRRCSYRKRFG